jgi:MSHA biogenesis protein MshI
MINQQVNLYTPELRPTRQRLHAGTAGTMVGIVLVMLVAAMAFGRWHNQALEQQVERLEQQNRNLESAVASMAGQVQARQPDADLEASLARITETIARRQRLLERVEGLATHNHGGFSGRLSALARQVPEDLWLTAVRLQSLPSAMRLEGRTRSAELVPGYLARLGEEPAFKGETFGDFWLQRPDAEADRQWVEFRVATEPGGESMR